MTQAVLYPNWRDKVVYSAEGPQPQPLLVSEKVKIIVAGLEPGQLIPAHPEAAAMYHFLEGDGWMIVNEARLPVTQGATVVMPAGTVRGIEAETRLAFLATRIA
jgi:quercetin dioxygenase-like cupin family protein